MSQADLPPEILAMPVAERVELVAKIWDSITDDSVGLSAEHRQILEQRLAEHRDNPQAGTSCGAGRRVSLVFRFSTPIFLNHAPFE